MRPPTNHWRYRRTEHRFNAEIATDITTRNSERKRHTIGQHTNTKKISKTCYFKECSTCNQWEIWGTWTWFEHKNLINIVQNNNKGNNKITDLRTILQRENQNSLLYKQTKSVNNRKTVKTVMTLTWYRHF